MFGSEHAHDIAKDSLARFTIRMLIIVSGGAFGVSTWLFGDMLKYNCTLEHVWFIYWFFASLIAAMMTPLIFWLGTTKTIRKIALASIILSLVMLAIGGTQFIWGFAQNQIVSCPDDSGGGDSQTYGA